MPLERLLISHVIRLAHRSQGKEADPLSDEAGKQITRCPMPDHVDENPSCVFNNASGDTGHFNCRACGASGFGNDLAKRLFPDKSHSMLLSELQALETSSSIPEPTRDMTSPPTAISPSSNRIISTPKTRPSVSRRPNHRQALQPGSDPSEINRRRRDLLSVNEAAARWYQSHLASPASHATAPDREMLGKTYFRRRGIDDETQAEFRLGYAPLETFEELHRHLREQGFPSSLLDQADIFRTNHSPFAGRAILPMQDEEGAVIGFGGRLVDRPKRPGSERASAGDPSNKETATVAQKAYLPKYMHTANIWVVENEIPLFKKGDWLFNMHRARTIAKDEGRLLVVEGYMDVVGLHQVGVREVVSPIGISLSNTQLQHLWDVVDTPVICLDGDQAGRRAAGRIAAKAYAILNPNGAKRLAARVASTMADQPGMVISDEERATITREAAVTPGGKSLKFALLDGGKDPFDVVREGMDHALIRAIMDLRPYSSGELSDKMHQGAAEAFEERLRNPTTLEAMVVEKLMRDVDDARRRADRAHEVAGSKRKQEDELERPSAKRQQANTSEAEAAVEAYLARKSLIRHQIMFPLVSWELRSPFGAKSEAGDGAWRTSILKLRRDLKTVLAELHQKERQLLLSSPSGVSRQQIEQIISATAALQIHDRLQSPEWTKELPIGSLPFSRLPGKKTQRAAEHSQHPIGARVTDEREAVSARARNYALVNRDLSRFESAALDSFVAALNVAPPIIQSMSAANERCRAGVKAIFDERLALQRKELSRVDQSLGEASMIPRPSVTEERRREGRARSEARG